MASAVIEPPGRSWRPPTDLGRFSLKVSASAGSRSANWRRQDQIDRRERGDGLTTDERAEVAALRRENIRLRQERDLLKRAADCFATENGTR
jgi:transposase-like protein